MGALQERFEKFFSKADGCWEWAAYKTKQGYGRFGYGGEKVYAHRIAWEIYVGEIPAGMCVCHHCDNPSCVNPAHLFIGTHTDNMRDCANKGRNYTESQVGESNNNAKLTYERVVAIRAMRRDGVKNAVLAKEFGVSKSTVSSITQHHIW